MMGKTFARFLATLVLGLTLSACGTTPDVPENHYYRLYVDAPGGASSMASSLSGTVVVTRFRTTGSLAGRPIIYYQADTPEQLKAYHYHFWDEPPGLLVRGELVTYLRAAGIGDKVVTVETRADPDYLVDGRVEQFERVLNGRISGVVELTLTLRRQRDGALLLSRTYREEAKKGGDLRADVKALSLATGRLFENFVADLRAL